MISKILLIIESRLGFLLPKEIRRFLRSHRQYTLGVDSLEMKNFYRVHKILRFFGQSWSSEQILEYTYSTYSELNQDLIPIIICKNSGYFVEFGACDGKVANNTFLLESKYRWQGLLGEPARVWHYDLIRSRSASIDLRAVYKVSNVKLEFIETDQPSLSTLQTVEQADQHALSRTKREIYEVSSVSLLDLLLEHKTPKHINYLSIDTEGSEFEILENFDFDQFSFSFINVEHNFTPSEKRVEELLTSNGYVRILQEISGGDAWYIQKEILNDFN